MVLYSFVSQLWSAITMIVVLGLFVLGAEGALFSLVPFAVDPRHQGLSHPCPLLLLATKQLATRSNCSVSLALNLQPRCVRGGGGG